MSELIFLLMGVMIGLAGGGLIACAFLESVKDKVKEKPAIQKEIYKTIGPDISLYEYTYGGKK